MFKLVYVAVLAFFITSCQMDNQIKLKNISSGDRFLLDDISKEIFAMTGKTISNVDYYLNNNLIEKIPVTNKNFSFILYFDNIGEFTIKLVAKNKRDKIISETLLKYSVISKKVTPPISNQAWMTFNYPAPESGQYMKHLNLWSTYYKLAVVSQLRSNGTTIRDLSGHSFGIQISLIDWCDAAMQGSFLVNLLNGSQKTFTFAGTSSGHRVSCKKFYPNNTSRTKFKYAKSPYGEGVRGYSVIPFRTIAVDPKIIPYGSLLYIPSAVGEIITLPNGEKIAHDGYFFAADTGGAIKRNHIDTYIGPSLHNPFNFVKSSSKQIFDAYIINSANIRNELNKFHRELRLP